jgi:hypothetical protein
MAFLIGTLSVGMTSTQIIAGFPGDLFVTLVGGFITYVGVLQKAGAIDNDGQGVSGLGTGGGECPAGGAQGVYRRFLVYSILVVIAGPLLAWLVFILPGWM